MYNSERNSKTLELLESAEARLLFIKLRKNEPYYKMFGRENEWEADVKKWEYIVFRLKKWYRPIFIDYVDNMMQYLDNRKK